ncbi:MAG: hypothetical protein HY650_06325 [Acidobacteria bacterium]|nr:hypothetical protein [Acidobacteriota bacterium]
MKKSLTLLFALLSLTCPGVEASEKPDFSGTWVLNSMKSKNMGFIAGLQATVTVKQTEDQLVIEESSAFLGQQHKREIHYDLKGKIMPNEGSQGEKSETVSSWVMEKLVTTWTNDGANSGTKITRTETRYLRPDGKTMIVESARGTTPPVIMLFEKM